MTAMTCEQWIALAHRAHDGEATADARARLGEHLASCEACAQAARGVAEVSSWIRAALPRPAAPSLGKAVRGRLAAERAREREWAEAGRIARRWAAAAAVAAAALLCAAVFTVRPAGAPRGRLDAEALLSRRAAPVTADGAAEIALAPGRLR